MKDIKVNKEPTLKKQWIKFKAENPKVRIRDAAEILNTSEAELLATGCNDTVTRLDVNFSDFLTNEIPKLGKVKALTRNDEVVHERNGEYLNPSFGKNAHVGLFVGEDIDLRVFLNHWEFTFAVSEFARGSERFSIQFFSKDGSAIHKIYLIKESNAEAFLKIKKSYKHHIQGIDENEISSKKIDPVKRNENPNKEKFQQDWLNLKDTHAFFPLMKKHGVTRLQSLELAPNKDGIKYAKKVSNDVIKKSLKKAAETNTPIMVFVGNKGMLQIHTGPIKKLLEMKEWYNIMDADFNLHIKTNSIKECWLVKKPTSDGDVNSIEIFNFKEELVCTFFGKRKPGIPEDSNWREIINEMDLN
ncbi:MAG: hemin-degrading factor [Flavobacteriales bacterium]|nr:hemin-degrading factor [Flavobacteriales bacterium]|tara:strand:- start:2499 stop:3572 length:1074 start_codon:yes stop_codon:yes gene_type:complete